MQPPLVLNQVALHLLLRAVQLLLVVEPDGVSACWRCGSRHCCFPGLLLELPWLLVGVVELPWLLVEVVELPWLLVEVVELPWLLVEMVELPWLLVELSQ